REGKIKSGAQPISGGATLRLTRVSSSSLPLTSAAWRLPISTPVRKWLSLPKFRVERTDDVARLGSDGRQRLQSARSSACQLQLLAVSVGAVRQSLHFEPIASCLCLTAHALAQQLSDAGEEGELPFL